MTGAGWGDWWGLLKKQELIKCVVVGNSAVGKMRLIVARATRQPMIRAQLFQATHSISVGHRSVPDMSRGK